MPAPSSEALELGSVGHGVGWWEIFRHGARRAYESRHMIASTLVALAAATPMTFAQDSTADSTSASKELGAVRWQRRLEPALEASAADGKPVLLLFQEVPG